MGIVIPVCSSARKSSETIGSRRRKNCAPSANRISALPISQLPITKWTLVNVSSRQATHRCILLYSLVFVFSSGKKIPRKRKNQKKRRRRRRRREETFTIDISIKCFLLRRHISSHSHHIASFGSSSPEYLHLHSTTIGSHYTLVFPSSTMVLRSSLPMPTETASNDVSEIIFSYANGSHSQFSRCLSHYTTQRRTKQTQFYYYYSPTRSYPICVYILHSQEVWHQTLAHSTRICRSHRR